MDSQEVALSRRSEIYIGDSRPISLEDLIYGYEVHEYGPHDYAKLFKPERHRKSLTFHLDCARNVKENDVWKPTHTMNIATCLVGKRSTNPRDICFAIKPVYPDLLSNIEVRYDKNVSDIYIELAATLLDGTWGTECLGKMLDIACMRLPKSVSLPSWAPDWSSEEAPWSDYQPCYFYTTSDSKAAGMFSADQRHLHCWVKLSTQAMSYDDREFVVIRKG